MPRYTILLPVFNGEKTLLEALDSIWAQRLDDFELLVIDDCSTDGTRGILEGVRDPRLRVLRQPRNLKLVEALNRGIDESRAPWVVRMDADDRMLPDRLPLLEQWCRSCPKVDVFGGNAWKINAEGKRVGALKKAQGSGPLRSMLLDDLWEPSPFIHPAVALRSSVAKEFRYDPQALHCEDYELWLRLARFGRTLVQRPEFVLEYRVSQMSLSHLHRTAQLQSSFEVFKRYFPEVKMSFSVFEALLGVGSSTLSYRSRVQWLRRIHSGRSLRVNEWLRQAKRAWT